ncbi:MAG: hypothetical protein IJZ29_04290 [Clostridia bacterium]|nr:hypothetical protein [Clostridia bacterium]
MKKILWLSRHQMTEEQIGSLKEKYGEVEVVQHDEQVNSASEILPLINEVDILAVVLPIDMVGNLLKLTDKPIIYAKNGREFTADGKVAFSFNGWHQYLKVDIETKPL